MKKQLLILGPAARARKLASRMVELGILFDFKPLAALPEKLPASLAGYSMVVLSQEQAAAEPKRLAGFELAGGLVWIMNESDWNAPSKFERIGFVCGLKLNAPAMARRMESVPDRMILDRTLGWVMEQTDLTWTDVLRYHVETLLQAYELFRGAAVLDRAAWMIRGALDARPPITNCDMVACIYPMLQYETITGDRSLVPACKSVADEYIANMPRYKGMFSNFIYDTGILRFEISFQVCPSLARLARVTGESKYYDIAVEQIILSDKYLLDKPTGLWRVGRSARGLTPEVWGRGCVSALRGMINTIEELPQDHPGQPKLRKILARFARGMLRAQAKDGHWNQLLAGPSHRAEPSATAWTVAAFAKGVRLGQLGDEYRRAMKKGWRAVKRQTWDGMTVAIAQGTTASADPDYYTSAMFIRPTYPHFILLAALENEEMKRL